MRTVERSGGFTLIELLIAVLLFGLIAVTFLPVLASSFAYIRRSGQRTEAVYRLQKKIERGEYTAPSAGKLNLVFQGKQFKIDINTFTVEMEYADEQNVSVFLFEADLAEP
ncbi:MAG: type II secretion system protein [Firmicutes bacterium]|nr:type II secretion system protein [Bacillota bacterium]